MKTQTKHTPGPWKAEGWNEIVVNSAEGYTLALAPSGRKSSSLEEIRANACLIAAAPDMVDALKWAESCFFPLIHANSLEQREHASKDAAHALERIRAALAKAEGGQ